MPDHPTLTDVEKATGETLEAGRKAELYRKCMDERSVLTPLEERTIAALAERDALIMRLAGERNTWKATAESERRKTAGVQAQLDDDGPDGFRVTNWAYEQACLAGNKQRDRAEQAEADLAAMTAERDRWEWNSDFNDGLWWCAVNKMRNTHELPEVPHV